MSPHGETRLRLSVQIVTCGVLEAREIDTEGNSIGVLNIVAAFLCDCWIRFLTLLFVSTSIKCSMKTQNEAVATNRSKKLKKSDPKDVENDEVIDQKAKDLGDLDDSMSEEEAKSDVVDLTSDNNPKGHVGKLELVEEGGSKKDTSMPVFDKELKGGVVEMVQNPMKEEELVCESKLNVNEEMKAESGVKKTNEDLSTRHPPTDQGIPSLATVS
ncbi:hypothetical protein SO802_013371 [Lithocarpus litseifolius]|uniref:Uncharacterized protein n=1 Tax=Lithocarpus litseifolius TaxID=425828 RepID=A0AAW2D935_9ROSI